MMYNRLKNLKEEVRKKGTNPNELDDDEVENILRSSGYMNGSANATLEKISPH